MTESIKYAEYSTIMNRIAGWLIVNGKSFKKRDAYGYFGRAATKHTIETVAKQRYETGIFGEDGLVTEYTECAIFDNVDLSFLPNYVTGTDGTKYYKDTFVDMANRVSAYEVLHGKSPLIVYIKNGNTTSNNSGSVTQAFKNALGNFDGTIDGALALIKGRGYGYYYNDRYNTLPTINAIKNRSGVNCTDSSQLFYRLGIENGYTVQFVHVRCSGGDGHVRLRLKHPVNTGGSWIYRDPAAVLNGNNVTSNWCTSGTVIAYDPSWIFEQLYN